MKVETASAICKLIALILGLSIIIGNTPWWLFALTSASQLLDFVAKVDASSMKQKQAASPAKVADAPGASRNEVVMNQQNP